MIETIRIRMEGTSWTRLMADIRYSVRRFYVDQFFTQACQTLPAGSLVLDLGGVRGARRGEFRIEDLPLNVKFANIVETAKPDYLCDAGRVPAESGSFDGVIMSEVIEHLQHPTRVFSEVTRLLRPGGRFLATVPFTFYYHPDPVDIARYTHDYYQATLPGLGLGIERLVAHGALATTAAGVLKDWAHELHRQNRPHSPIKRRLLHALVRRVVARAFRIEQAGLSKAGVVTQGYTTGYGISCIKA
jgi:SAM-dependent methyltransferase